jgi:hypothetical protein
MKCVKQYYISTGKQSGFNIDIEVIGVSANGQDVVVRPVAGSGSFIVNKHSLRNTIRNN